MLNFIFCAVNIARTSIKDTTFPKKLQMWSKIRTAMRMYVLYCNQIKDLNKQKV